MKAMRYLAAMTLAALTAAVQAAPATIFGGDLVSMGFTYNNEPPLGTEGYLVPTDGGYKQNHVMAPRMRIFIFDKGMTLIANEDLGFWSDEDTFIGLDIVNNSKSMDGFDLAVIRSQNFNGFDASHIHQEGNKIRINLIGVSAKQGGRLDLWGMTAAVPEPSTMALAAMGLAACALVQTRRKTAGSTPGLTKPVKSPASQGGGVIGLHRGDGP